MSDDTTRIDGDDYTYEPVTDWRTRAEDAERKLNDVLPGYVTQIAKLLEDNDTLRKRAEAAEAAEAALYDVEKRTKELIGILAGLSNDASDIKAPYTSISVIEDLGWEYIAQAMARSGEDAAESTWRVWQYMISCDDIRGKRLWADALLRDRSYREQHVALMQRTTAADERMAATLEAIAATLQAAFPKPQEPQP